MRHLTAGGGGCRCGMPNTDGDARECPKDRWSGGPVRSGGREGFQKGRVAELSNRGHGSARLLALSIWLPPYGFAASVSPVPGRE